MRAALRTVPLLMASLCSAACQKEPDFDTQYDATKSVIDARTKALDAEMANKMEAMDREMDVRGFATPSTQPTTTDRSTPDNG